MALHATSTVSILAFIIHFTLDEIQCRLYTSMSLFCSESVVSDIGASSSGSPRGSPRQTSSGPVPRSPRNCSPRSPRHQPQDASASADDLSSSSGEEEDFYDADDGIG